VKWFRNLRQRKSKGMNTDIFFISFLANVDSSFQSLKLKDGFSVKNMSLDECNKFVIKLKKHAPSVNENLVMPILGLNCFNNKEKVIYYITNSIKINNNSELDTYDYIWKYIKETGFGVFHNTSNEYLEILVKKLKLFKEGYIDNIWNFCYYYCEDGNIMAFGLPILTQFNQTIDLKDGNYLLDSSDSQNFEIFSNEFQLPFSDNNLKLSHEYFEKSYNNNSREICFLTLMIGMEILFNKYGTELTYRISRCVGVLLGRNSNGEKSEEIINDIKRFYKLRSFIVHNGEAKITNADILKLRHYLRESIQELYNLNQNKDKYIPYLESLGYNQRCK